ncbi:MAG: L,D-transpeptidase family protein [Bradyrhizobium sp.]|nr:L,D-transpeptidase family protein [Bradyrhizobium sp.]
MGHGDFGRDAGGACSFGDSASHRGSRILPDAGRRYAPRIGAPIQSRLCRDRCRESGGRSLGPRRRRESLAADDASAAAGAARGRRRQRGRNASVLFSDEGRSSGNLSIGIGDQGTDTPIGQTRILRKREKPALYRTASEIKAKPWAPKIVPPGPNNPLGDYALYLGWPSYLIHGTDDWRGIGRRDSRGCIRMYPEDIERLFQKIPLGAKVTVVDQPIKLAWMDGRLFLEIHPSARQQDALEMGDNATFEDPTGLAKKVLAAAGNAADRLDWAAIRQAAVSRNGIPIAVTR